MREGRGRRGGKQGDWIRKREDKRKTKKLDKEKRRKERGVRDEGEKGGKEEA